MDTNNKQTKKAVFEERRNAVCRATIFGAPETSYGPDYKNHMLAQYKLFVESVNYTSELKLKINTYFLTINTALITAIGLAISRNTVNSLVWHLILPLAGMSISLIWWGTTYSYKQRNISKLRIVHCIEERLPLALYKTEWRLMDENHANPVKKFFFQIDLFIPWVFAVSYLLFIALS